MSMEGNVVQESAPCEFCGSTEHKTEEHSETGEWGVPFVDITKIIPEINMNGIDRWPKRKSGYFMDKAMRDSTYVKSAGNLVRKVSSSHDSEIRHGKEDVFKRLKDQVVVDLGAGHGYAYLAAMEEKARGYIAVEPINNDGLKDFLTKAGHAFEDKIRETTEKIKEQPIDNMPPATIIADDMYAVLRKLPNNSVSIICSSIDQAILTEDETKRVEEEIIRVLDPKGIAIFNLSDIYPDETKGENRDISLGLRIFIKKEEARV